MHPRCGRSLKQTSPGKILRYHRTSHLFLRETYPSQEYIIMYYDYHYYNDHNFIHFRKISLPKHAINSYDPTFVIEPFATNSAQPRRRYFTGTVWRYTLSNSANLGVRRTQETALPMDRVVFIINASKKITLSPPLSPVTVVANELSTWIMYINIYMHTRKRAHLYLRWRVTRGEVIISLDRSQT